MSVASLAQYMGISVAELVKALESKGIKVNNPNSPLSIDQKKKIGKAIGIELSTLKKSTKKEAQIINKTSIKNENPKVDTSIIKNNINFIKGKKVFIDTCSILSDDFYDFWNSIESYLKSSSTKIIIPTKVAEELKKLSNKKDTSEKAKKAIAFLTGKQSFIDLRGEQSDNFADNVFNYVFTKYRIHYELILITQDKNLSRDILQLNKSKSTNGKNVYVYSIHKYGELKHFSEKETANNNCKGMQNTKSTKKKTIPIKKPIEKFEIASVPTSMPDVVIPVKKLPIEGQQVKTSSGMIKLGKELARGGEGAVYDLPGNYVCKVYKEDCITTRRKAKIEKMLSKKVDCKGICWPTEIVYNEHNEFVGYIMPKASGKEIQRSIFFKHLMKIHFPNWKKKDLVQLCITILDKIQYLHDRNIIIGDINPANILVVSPTEVYFVDTDSYQIEDFPCPVGMVNFTAPEIQRRRFSEFLRSKGNEHFAVATLLFMILVPGKPPYSQQGGGKPIDNVINMNFAYPFQGKSTGTAPDGPWRYIWSHFTFDIKQAFYQTFMKGEARSTEDTRIPVSEWKKRLSHYYVLLTDGKLEGQDPMSLELFPSELKRVSNMTYVECRLCKKEKQENHMEQGICMDCLKEEEYYRCSRCSCEMSYSNRQKYIYKNKKHDTCKDCIDKLNSIHSIIRCTDCGTNFNFLVRDYEYYVKQGFSHYPKKCTTCRKNKSTTQTFRPTTTTSRTKKSSGFCFITTATCEYFQKPDDCYELETFRSFRDRWLSVQPGGKELIKEYYDVAPMIVESINNSKFRKDIYINIETNYLKPCLELIENNNMEACKELYIKMVKDLKNEYLK